MADINVGVIGIGHMGQNYCRIFASLDGARLVGVCDAREDVVRRVADDYNIRAYTSWRDLVQNKEIQAVAICTPEPEHTAPCIAAAEEGKAVLVEKPIALSLEDAKAILTAAQKSGVILMVGHVLRFEPHYVLARQMIEAGEIGDIVSIHTRRCGTDIQGYHKARCSLATYIGVHEYDIIRWYLGSEPLRVYAESHRGVLTAKGYDVDDTIWSLFKFQNSAVAATQVCWTLPKGHPTGIDQRVDIIGTEGALSVSGGYEGLMMWDNARLRCSDATLWPTIRGKVRGALEDELRHFVDCVATGNEPLVTGHDGARALQMALLAEESARRGAPVQFPEGL